MITSLFTDRQIQVVWWPQDLSMDGRTDGWTEEWTNSISTVPLIPSGDS